ncbi:porin [Cupriavidus sp. amp6]|uniref:porin n=1 Tax=Cupriavidus sp. amp6 TaxID=388051 RepID=UPI002101C02C|nr:porin [Cupriavidus sp. amp6]
MSCTVTQLAHAEGSVTLFGLVDTTIRYTTNENPSGDRKLQMAEGVLTGSRWGLIGKEELGGNNQAIFVLESGFALDSGQSLQGGRLFGRRVYTGLQGEFGTITLGRQYTVIHEAIAKNDAMALANLALVGFQGGNYTGGVRQDNMLKYTGIFGGFSIAAQHAFGEVAGSVAKSSSTGGSISYAGGPFSVTGGYQIIRDTASYFGVTVPVSDQKVWTLGGNYAFGKAKLFLNYVHNSLTTADYRNQVVHLGLSYSINSAWTFTALGNYDHLNHASQSGNRYGGALMLDYAMSKRTDVYAEADYTKLSGAWTTLASQNGFTTPFYGHDNRVGLTVGVRHKF